MATDVNKSPQKVNPFLLIVLGIAVLAFVVNYFLTKFKEGGTPPTSTMNTAVTSPNSQVPSSSNMTTPTNTPTDNQNSGTLNQNVREKDSAQKGKSMKDEKGTSSEYALNRNPFLTPYIYLKNINNNSSPTPTPVITHVTPTPTVNPTPTPSAGPELRLGAICQQKNDKVAIIYVNGKGYIRRENEKIGGTEYYLKQISDKSVIIAKYNGEEKILKINEKALKLKGGD